MSSPVASALKALLGQRPDVRVAVLFGSEARGTSHASSDVDVAIDAPGVDLLALGAWLAEGLDREVDAILLDEATIPLLERIIAEGVVVHEGFPGAAALWRSRTLATLETDRPWYSRMADAWLERVRTKGLAHG